MLSCQACKSNYLSSSSSYSVTSRPHQARKLPNPKKLPLVLRCGHTFCEGCISKLKEKIPKPQKQGLDLNLNSPPCCVDLDLDLHYKFKLPCPYPECGVITLIRNGLQELPENMYILSHLEKDKDAEMRRIFNDIVAGASGDNHVGNKSQSLNQLKAGVKEVQRCKIHQRIIEYFCEDDDSLICSRCYIMGDHKNHTIQSIEEKNKVVFGEIETRLGTAKTVLSHLNLLDKKSSVAMLNLKAYLIELIKNINQSFMHIHTLLQAREAEMMDCVSAAFKSSILSFENEKKKSLNAKWDLKILLEEATNLLENTGVVIDGSNIAEQLKVTSQIPCIIPKHSEIDMQCNLRWQEQKLTELITVVQSFGEITGSLNAFKLKTFDEAGEGIEEDQLSVMSECSASYPSSDLQSFCSQSSQTSADVVIESDSENGSSETSMNSQKDLHEKKQKKARKFNEKIVVPTLKGAPHQVSVTHINSPCDFFVQLNANKNKLETLAHNINSWCCRQTSTKHIPQTLERGTLVLACFGVDQLWYRAQILDIIEADVKGEKKLKVRVRYIDFGNEETIFWTDVRSMQDRFLRYPEFSVRCCLHDIAPYEKDEDWEYKDGQKFLMMTNNKVLLLNAIAITGSVYFVDLISTPTENVSGDGFASVRDMLVFMQHARFCGSSVDFPSKMSVPASKDRHFYKPTALKTGDTTAVTVTEILSPSDLYVIPMGEDINYYLRMQEKMQETYKKDMGNIYLVHWPREDMLCAVLGKGGKWYRGQILQVVSHEKVTVYLPDVGRTLVVPCEKLRKLLSDFIKLPSQAVNCSLIDVAPLEGEPGWSNEARRWCKTKVKGMQGMVRIVRWGEPTEIVLWLGEDDGVFNSQTVNFQLVKLGLAQSCGLSSMSLPQTVPQNTEAKVNSLKTSAQSPNKTNSPPQKKSAMSPSSQKSSPTKNVTSPKATTPTSRPPVKKSPKHSTARRQIALDECEMSHDAMRTTSSHLSPGKKDQHTAVKSAKTQKNKENEGLSTSYVEIIICNYKSPGHFYIRMQENEIMLSDLMEDLQKTYQDSEADEKEDWVVEDYCAIRDEMDNIWYRGKITAVRSLSDIDVEFLDYGRSEQNISSKTLRILTHELGLRLHCAAVRCHLANLIAAGSSDPQRWTKTAIEFMVYKVKDKKLFLKTEGEPTDEGLPVDIIIEEEIPPTAFEPVQHCHHSLRKLIQEHGLAMESNAKRSASLTGASVGDTLEKKIYEKVSLKSEGLQDEDISKDSGNVSSSPRALKEMQSPSSATEQPADSSSDDQYDTVVEIVKARSEQMEEVPSLDIPPFPYPSAGDQFEVVPTFVDYSCVIFAQPVMWEAAIIHLTEELQRLYEDSQARPVAWKPGQSCVAKFTDDNLWYRGIIQAVESGKARVFYLDFGNSSWVSFSNMRLVTADVASQHVLAYSCVVDDLSPNSEDGLWPVPILGIIHEMLVNGQCTMTVTGVDQGASLLKVKIQKSNPPGWDLSSILVEKGYAISNADLSLHYDLSRKISEALIKHDCFSQLDAGDVGDTFKAIVTQVELPNLIYLQKLRQSEEESFDFVKLTDIAELNKGIDEFEEMMVQINSTTSQSCVDLPSVGLMCLGQFGFDKRWYRALCIEQYPEQDACLVVYIDYGNSEIVSKDHMRLLPTEYWSMPALSFRCYINLIPPSGPDSLWHKGSLDAMMAALSNKELVVTVTQKSPLTVELRMEDEGSGQSMLVYEDLISKGLALLPSTLGVEELPTVIDDDVEVEEEVGDKTKEEGDDET